MSGWIAGPGGRLDSLLRIGRLWVLLYVGVHAVLALTTDGVEPTDVACLVLVSVPTVLISRQRGHDLPLRTALVVGACLVAAAVVGLWTMQPGLLDQTYAAWFLGAIAIDLLGVVILGRARIAWAVMAVVVALAVGWAVVRGMPPADGAGLVVRHVATLLVGTLVSISLRRSRIAFAAFRALRLRRAASEEEARVRAAERRVAVEQVLDQAGPTLRAIADGRRLGDEDRRQMLVLEGALRDQIRTPLLVRGALRESVAQARRRGVNVLLMDEAEGADPQQRAAAADWLADRLDRTDAGGFVGRLRDLGGAVRASAVHEDRGESRSFPEQADGRSHTGTAEPALS